LHGGFDFGFRAGCESCGGLLGVGEGCTVVWYVLTLS
jgi:hypothetical protein